MSHQPPYRNYPLQANSAMRKGPMPPNPQPRPPNHEFFEQQMRERHQMEMTKRRSARPTDRNLPEGIDKLAVGDAPENYNKLRELERQLDMVIMRKRLDMQDSYQTLQPRQGTLRLWISNTVENQPWQQAGSIDHESFDFSSNVEAMFRVKIEGRLLEHAHDIAPKPSTDKQSSGDSLRGESEPAAKKPRLSSSPSTKRLSSFFKSIAIDFDRPSELQPDRYNRINWDKSSLSGTADTRASDFDCLEFARKGDENINITISLTREEANPKMKLAPPLAELLGMELSDRKTVLMSLWEYIKYNKLFSEGGDGRTVQCDQPMKDALGCGDHVYFPELVNKINAVMYDAPPVQLNYTIRVDKDFHSGDRPSPKTIYDIPVPIENSFKDQISSFLHPQTQTRVLSDIVHADDELAIVIQRINHAKAKHGFFTSLSKDPANFIKRWVSSQKRDLDVIMGAGAWGEEDWQGAEWRHGGADGPWGSHEAWEGVGSYLMKQDTTKQRGAATS